MINRTSGGQYGSERKMDVLYVNLTFGSRPVHVLISPKRFSCFYGHYIRRRATITTRVETHSNIPIQSNNKTLWIRVTQQTYFLCYWWNKKNRCQWFSFRLLEIFSFLINIANYNMPGNSLGWRYLRISSVRSARKFARSAIDLKYTITTWTL